VAKLNTRGKLKQLIISTEILVDMLKTGKRIGVDVMEGLPEDAQCIGVIYDYGRPYKLSLIIESESFEFGEYSNDYDIPKISLIAAHVHWPDKIIIEQNEMLKKENKELQEMLEKVGM